MTEPAPEALARAKEIANVCALSHYTGEPHACPECIAAALTAEAARVREERDELREALEFYANGFGVDGATALAHMRARKRDHAILSAPPATRREEG